MAQVNPTTGQIEPSYSELLTYYLSHSKDEKQYMSNKEIAECIQISFADEDVADIIRVLAEQL